MKYKKDFKPFLVGSIFNKLNNIYKVSPVYKSISIKYPSRLNAMALDPSKIATNNNFCYTPGEIIFKINIFKEVTIKIIKSSNIIISSTSKRKPLIMHSALIMKKALNYNGGFEISVIDETEIKHSGLGSSSSLIASVACAINEIFANPIPKGDLLKYLAQNHGEEVDGNDNILVPVQCIGGSAAGGLYNGGMLVLAGNNNVISQMNIDSKFKVIIGIPNDFRQLDAQHLLNEEIKSFPNFIKCGKKYGHIIAYRMIHELLPAMKNNDLFTIGNVIFDYRFKMGSIKNCSFCYKKLPLLAKRLAYLKEKNIAQILSISSVGPGFFVITCQPKKCIEYFQRAGLNIFTAKIFNGRYKILNRS